jgi:anti-sigma regulatory factor (Ser/Thr protein kinase)
MNATLTLTVACQDENLALLGSACRALAQHHLGDEQLAARVELAIVETCSNIMRHGHPENPEHTFGISVLANDSGLDLTIRDEGPAFVFDRREMPAFAAGDLANWPEGGFGLPLVFATMDAVDYQHTDGINQIRLFVRRR